MVFTYIGYEKQELPAQNGMKVTMKDNAAELQEVVVTGYQVQRKADLTGAVAVMDMKGPISESDPNMLNSMQGKLAGVDIVTDANAVEAEVFASSSTAVNASAWVLDANQGGSTGIVEIENHTANNNCYYDLQGRRLNGVPQKGIYITNGKKYVAS